MIRMNHLTYTPILEKLHSLNARVHKKVNPVVVIVGFSSSYNNEH